MVDEFGIELAFTTPRSAIGASRLDLDLEAANLKSVIGNLGVETGDVDLDGDTDIILTPMEWFGPGPNGTVGIPTLYLNGGGAQGGTEGIFAKDWSFLPTTAPFMVHRASLFDADGDGDLDFYSCGFGSITGSPAGFQDHFFLNLIP